MIVVSDDLVVENPHHGQSVGVPIARLRTIPLEPAKLQRIDESRENYSRWIVWMKLFRLIRHFL